MSIEVLREELEFFEINRAKWLEEYRGKFALVKGKRLVGTFDTAENAYIEGIQQFGNVPFLIKQVVERDPVASFPALELGLIRARP
jgi:hypothetical protein